MRYRNDSLQIFCSRFFPRSKTTLPIMCELYRKQCHKNVMRFKNLNGAVEANWFAKTKRVFNAFFLQKCKFILLMLQFCLLHVSCEATFFLCTKYLNEEREREKDREADACYKPLIFSR